MESERRARGCAERLFLREGGDERGLQSYNKENTAADLMSYTYRYREHAHARGGRVHAERRRRARGQVGLPDLPRFLYRRRPRVTSSTHAPSPAPTQAVRTKLAFPALPTPASSQPASAEQQAVDKKGRPSPPALTRSRAVA